MDNILELNITNENNLLILLLIQEQCHKLWGNAYEDIKNQHEEETKDIQLDDSDDLIKFTLLGGAEDIFPNEDEDLLSIIGELQLLDPFLAGYLSRLSKRVYSSEEVQDWIIKLENYNILALQHVQKWYLGKSQLYPNLRDYLDELDYLRLKLIEYLKALSNL